MDRLFTSLKPLAEDLSRPEVSAFIERRAIPLEVCNDLYYVENLLEWARSQYASGVDFRLSISRSGEILEQCLPWLPYYPASTFDPRLPRGESYSWLHGGFILSPSRSTDGSLQFFLARSLEKGVQGDRRFVWLCHPEGRRWGLTQALGLENLDLNNTIYLVEGIFDRFYLRNSIAYLGTGNLWRVLKYLEVKQIPPKQICLIPDNEPDRKYLRTLAKILLKREYRVYLWPRNMREMKDPNDMAQAGYSDAEIHYHIEKGLVHRSEVLAYLKAYLKTSIAHFIIGPKLKLRHYRQRALHYLEDPKDIVNFFGRLAARLTKKD